MGLQWSVYRAGLDPVHGHEQSGERPVLVVSAEPLNEWYEVVTVVPITSRRDGRPGRLGEVLLPAGTAGLQRDSFALCYQARCIDKERLLGCVGSLDDEGLREAIAATVALCLDLPYRR